MARKKSTSKKKSTRRFSDSKAKMARYASAYGRGRGDSEATDE